MKDAYQILRHKEAELARIRHEIASLRIVAPLLCDDSHSDPHQENEHSGPVPSELKSDSGATGTDDLFSFTSAPRPGIWNVLRRGK